MRLFRAILVCVVMVGVSVCAVAQEAGGASAEGAWLREPSFWVATAANVAGIGLFVARVHWPVAAPIFGYVTQAIGTPALAFGIADLVYHRADATTVGLLAYAGWALGAALVDHVLQLEYRHPVRPGILIPYVVAYYAGIGVLSATQLTNGIVPWAIAGGTCILTVAASFYARWMGAD
jgi:hypothetical protein